MTFIEGRFNGEVGIGDDETVGVITVLVGFCIERTTATGRVD